MAQETPANRIPEVHGTNLVGQSVDLPAMLKQRAGVLIVGFGRESRDQATSWGKRLEMDFGSSPDVLYYELPVLEDVPNLLRGFVLRSIGKDISERAKLHFVALTKDEAAWKSVAHFTGAKNAYVLVVDGDGIVRWKAQGEPTEERYAAMRRAVGSIVGPRS